MTRSHLDYCRQVVGIDAILAERTPAEKVDAVGAEAGDHVTVMVGDGVNDAPALAAAAVGIVEARGTVRLGLVLRSVQEVTAMMYWYDGHGMNGWGWSAMSLGMLLLWVVVIIGAVLLVRALVHAGDRGRTPTQPPATPPTSGTPAGPSPEQVLADRFARGEIDEQEYRARLAARRKPMTSGASGEIVRAGAGSVWRPRRMPVRMAGVVSTPGRVYDVWGLPRARTLWLVGTVPCSVVRMHGVSSTGSSPRHAGGGASPACPVARAADIATSVARTAPFVSDVLATDVSSPHIS